MYVYLKCYPCKLSIFSENGTKKKGTAAAALLLLGAHRSTTAEQVRLQLLNDRMDGDLASIPETVLAREQEPEPEPQQEQEQPTLNFPLMMPGSFARISPLRPRYSNSNEVSNGIHTCVLLTFTHIQHHYSYVFIIVAKRRGR